MSKIYKLHLMFRKKKMTYRRMKWKEKLTRNKEAPGFHVVSINESVSDFNRDGIEIRIVKYHLGIEDHIEGHHGFVDVECEVAIMYILQSDIWTSWEENQDQQCD
jgi:hypothetical protein